MNTINRTNDRVFKTIFGSEAHKKITLNLINAVFEFEGVEQIDDIEFLERQFDPKHEFAKLSILDIRSKTKDGVKINIEMQVVNEKNYRRRSLYYWAKLYCDDLQAGQNYNDLTSTIMINLLSFKLLDCEDYHSMYSVYNIKNMDQLSDDMKIHIVEIPKWKVKNIKEMKRLDKWLAYFSNKVSKEEMEAIAMSEPAIQEAIRAESIFTQDDRMRYEYQQREKEIRDYRSELESYKMEGIKEGKEKLVLSMLRKNKLRAEEIAELTDLPLAYVESVKKKM